MAKPETRRAVQVPLIRATGAAMRMPGLRTAYDQVFSEYRQAEGGVQ
ncbi:MAG: hypothetical protein AAFY82_08890 [Pseudomonadota bacterium]